MEISDYVSTKPSIFILVIVCLLAACTFNQRTDPSLDEPALQAPEVLITPVAQSPAAGLCGEFDQDTATIVINPDIPDPRCAKVHPHQKLKVINMRGESIQVRIGPFEAQIPDGSSHLFDLPFGEYLAPGVHQLIVSPCCGPEILLTVP